MQINLDTQVINLSNGSTEHVGAAMINLISARQLYSLGNQKVESRHLLSYETEIPKYLKKITGKFFKQMIMINTLAIVICICWSWVSYFTFSNQS